MLKFDSKELFSLTIFSLSIFLLFSPSPFSFFAGKSDYDSVHLTSKSRDCLVPGRLSKCAKELAHYFHRCVSFYELFPTKLGEKGWQKFAWASWKDLTKELWARLHGDYTAFLVLTIDLSNKKCWHGFFIFGPICEKMAINFLVTQQDDLSLYTGTSASIVFISNIQGTKKYSAVMYH